MSAHSLFIVDTSPAQINTQYIYREKTEGEGDVSNSIELLSDTRDLVLKLLEANYHHSTTIDSNAKTDDALNQTSHGFDSDQEDASFQVSARRYWKEPTGISCSICQEADHQARDCEHELCLTCGAIDEHTTRACPVSLVCHACGSRGHLSRHCPSSSRVSNRRCDRCDSAIHLTQNCPSIWRRYQEETNKNPQRVLQACYNCGDTGDHLGDHCPFGRRDHRFEPSAFNSNSYSTTERDRSRNERRRKEAQHDDDYRDGQRIENHHRTRDDHRHPFSSRPKTNHHHHHSKKTKDREDVDEGDRSFDWFSNRQKSTNRIKKSPQKPSSSESKRIRIGGSYKGGYTKS